MFYTIILIVQYVSYRMIMLSSPPPPCVLTSTQELAVRDLKLLSVAKVQF